MRGPERALQRALQRWPLLSVALCGTGLAFTLYGVAVWGPDDRGRYGVPLWVFAAGALVFLPYLAYVEWQRWRRQREER